MRQSTAAGLALVAVLTTPLAALAEEPIATPPTDPTPVAAPKAVAGTTSAAQETDATNSTVSLSAEKTVNMLESVPSGDQAYGALRTLQRDGYLAKYPDDAFQGRPLTKYEVAVVTQTAANQMSKDLQSPESTKTVTQNDLDALKQLLTNYGSQMDDLRSQVVALSDTLQKTQKKVEANTALLDRQRFGVQYFLRAPGIYSEHVTAYNGNSNFVVPSGVSGVVPGTVYAANGKLPGGTQLLTGNNPGQFGQNLLTAGDYGHGTGYQRLRVLFSGSVDPETSYLIRLEDTYYFSNVNGFSTTTPLYCATALSCNANADYPTNAALRLNIVALRHEFPNTGGFYVQAGRMLETEGPRAYGDEGSLGLAYEDYFNGAEAGYTNLKFHASLGYGFGSSSLSNTGQSFGTTGQQLFGTANYSVTPKVTAGVSYLVNNNYQNQEYFNPNAPLVDSNGFVIRDLAGNPITGAYQPYDASNLSVGTIFASYHPNDKTAISLEGLHRFGNSPVTGVHWTDADAFYFLAQYGNLIPQVHGNFVEAGLIEAGFNSTAPQTKIAGSPDYQQFYIPDPNGYRVGYLGIHHWFSESARIGLEYQNIGLIPNFVLPASSSTCPGCVVTKDQRNALLLEMYLQF